MNKKPKAKNNLIVDFYELKNINILQDSADTSITEFEAYAQEADKKNLNDRIYPSPVLIKALDKVQPEIKKNKVVSYVDHPNWIMGEQLERIGAIITSAHLVDGVVQIKGKFTSTDAAKNLKALLKDGYSVGISARGRGTATYDEKQKAYILNDDYVVDGWDFVSTPAVKKAMVTAFENYNKQNNNEEDSEMEKFNSLAELRVAYPAFIAEALKPIEDQNGKIVADNVTLAKELKDSKEAIAKLETEKKALADSLAKATETIEKAKFDAAVADMLKDNKFKAYIAVPATIKTVEDAKVYIDAETAKYEKFLAENKTDAASDAAPKTEVPKVPAKTEDKKQTPADLVIDEYIRLATRA
jgi:hypothetical protein